MSITITDLDEPVANGLSMQAAVATGGNICDAVRGLWQGSGSTDEMMKELRGED